MGRYADPQMIVDKRFEKVRGELDKLYKNIDNNLTLITKRKQARKQAQAKKYGSYGDIYNKAVKDSRASSRKFARTRPDMAKDAKKEFSDQLASRFDEGYDNIQAFVRGEYIPKEGAQPIKNPTESQINAFVQSQIDAANDLGESLVAFEAMANEHAKGIKAGDGSDGKNTNSVVIGSEFSNIFNAMTGDKEGQDDIHWSRMKLSGSLTGGTTIYFDAQSEGEEGFGIADSTEIIDLSKAKKNYMNGNQEVYFQTIKDKTEVAKDIAPVLKTVQKNKEIEFQEIVRTTDENGNPVEMEIPNKRKRQDYFISGKGSSVTIDAMIEKHGGITATVQAYYGANIAAQFPEPGEEGYDQAMLKLKARIYEDLDPLMSDGTRKLLSPNKETRSRQYTKDTSADVVKGFYKDVHLKTGELLPKIPSQDALNDYNLYIQDRPYSQGSKTYTIDHMEPAGDGNPSHMVLFMKEGNKKVRHEGFFDVSTPEGRRKLEEGLLKGNFQGTTDRRHVDGLSNSSMFYGGQDAGEYNGSEKESLRITNSETEGGITFQQYLDKVEGSEKELNHKTIDWPWDPQGQGAGTQAAASTTTTTTSTATSQATTVQPQATEIDNTGVNYALGTENPDASEGGSIFSLKSSKGGSLQFKSADAKSQLLEQKDDGKNALRKIGNFEALAGSPSGKGLEDYGMGPEYLKQVKDAGLDPSTEEGFMYAVETIAKGNVINELNLPEPARFDELDETLKASMIDWEYNTGRDVGDLMHIAQMMKMEKLDSNGEPTGEYEWQDKIDLGGMTLTQLVNAGGSKKVNVKIGDKTYKTAAEAMKAIKADDSPISVELTEITPEEVANAKHAIMSDKTSRSASDIATYNKTWKYRIDQLK